MRTGLDGDAPAEFIAALASIDGCELRDEVQVRRAAAPTRIAPFTTALTGEVGDDSTSGRFILLYDPAGHDAWQGRFRVVTLARADLEPELAADDLLGEVAWTWVEDALESAGATAIALGGTVTRLSSQSFGALGDRLPEGDLEVRASWSPADSELGIHLAAWAALLCTLAGLPPLPDGVTMLRSRRGGKAQ